MTKWHIAGLPADVQQRLVARLRGAAMLLANGALLAVLLLEVLGEPAALEAVRRLCAS